jgi:defect-in-organelle-trafficking protein DotC
MQINQCINCLSHLPSKLGSNVQRFIYSTSIQPIAIKLSILFFLFILLTACGSHQQNLDNIDTTNLNQLEGIRVTLIRGSTTNAKFSNLRAQILQDSALSLGAQGGLAWASEQINTKTNQDRKYLDNIFNFHAMMLSHGVLPPVLAEGDNSLNLDDPSTIRVADKTYKIIKQARFATTAPNWREYLWLPFTRPALPHATLLPRNDFEQRIWRTNIRIGWEKGIAQSYSIFQQNLARLKRDFRGMALYRKLLQMKMISPPFVARTELGITGDGENMRINDQVLRIVEHPELQTNSRNWNAVVIKRNG